MPDMNSMRRDFYAYSVSDELTRKTIHAAYAQDNLLLEPHGAVGWAGLERYMKSGGDCFAVSLETADPAKFPEEIVSILGFEPQLPKSLKGLDDLAENVTHMPQKYENLKVILSEMA
jgi:threonine synthase